MLSGLPQLAALELQGNLIDDISGLSCMPSLHTLDLRHNLITDLSALLLNPGLGSLATVKFTGNDLVGHPETLCEQIPELLNNNVMVYYEYACVADLAPPDQTYAFTLAGDCAVAPSMSSTRITGVATLIGGGLRLEFTDIQYGQGEPPFEDNDRVCIRYKDTHLKVPLDWYGYSGTGSWTMADFGQGAASGYIGQSDGRRIGDSDIDLFRGDLYIHVYRPYDTGFPYQVPDSDCDAEFLPLLSGTFFGDPCVGGIRILSTDFEVSLGRSQNVKQLRERLACFGVGEVPSAACRGQRRGDIRSRNANARVPRYFGSHGMARDSRRRVADGEK